MNRGSDARGALCRCRYSGFNEAPIHESGKCSWGSSRARPRSSFNEAPIHESGKYRMKSLQRLSELWLQ